MRAAGLRTSARFFCAFSGNYHWEHQEIFPIAGYRGCGNKKVTPCRAFTRNARICIHGDPARQFPAVKENSKNLSGLLVIGKGQTDPAGCGPKTSGAAYYAIPLDRQFARS